MAVIANLDINMRANTASMDQGITKSSDKIKKLASDTTKSAGIMSSAFSKLKGFGGDFLAAMPNGGNLSKMLGAIASPLATLKQLGMGLFEIISGVFTLDPVALLQGLGNLKDVFTSLAKSAGVIGAAFVGMGLAAMPGITALSKSSQKLGIDTETLAGYVHGSRLELDELDHILTKLSKHVYDAENGSKEASQAFAKLGVTSANLKGGMSPEVINRMADGFLRLGSNAEQNAIAMQLLGKSGADALRLFKGGSQGIAQAITEAKQLGLSVTQAQAQQVASAQGAIGTLKKAFTGIGRTAAIAIAPLVEMAANAVTSWVKKLQEFRQPIADWFQFIRFGLENFSESWSLAFDKVVLSMVKWVADMNKALDGMNPFLRGLIFGGVAGAIGDAAEKKEKDLQKAFDAKFKAFQDKWNQFLNNVNEAKPIKPGGPGGPDTKGNKNPAAELGSKEAFEIIAGFKEDKMFGVANKTLEENKKIHKVLEQIFRKKQKGINAAQL